MPSVSVIIPTYNHAQFVLDTIKSVLAQSYEDYEIIVINDGSPDDSANILRPLSEAGQIRYYQQENAGQAAARNKGLQEARGEYIAYLDDDDLWPPDKLNWQTQRLRDNPCLGMVAGSMKLLDSNHPRVSSDLISPVAARFEQFFYGCPLTSPGQALIRADILKKVGGFDITIWGADDYDLWFRLAKVTQIELWQKTALHYRKHNANASHDLPRMYQNSQIVISRHLWSLPVQKRIFYNRVAARYLYDYLGKKMMLEVKERFLNGQIKQAYHAFLLIQNLLVPMALDPKLTFQVCRDLIFAKSEKDILS